MIETPTPPAIGRSELDEATEAFRVAVEQYRALASMGNRDSQAYLADLALNAAILAGDGTLMMDALWWSQLTACHNLRIDVFRLTRALLLNAKIASQNGFDVAANGHRHDALALLTRMAQGGDEEAAEQASIVAAEALRDSPTILASIEPQGTA